MKLLKGFLCCIALLFSTVLLAGCSVDDEEANEFIREIKELNKDNNNIQIKGKGSYKENNDNKVDFSIKYYSNEDGNYYYEESVKGKQDGKKYEVNVEIYMIKKSDNEYKIYIDNETEYDREKEESKKVYTDTQAGVEYYFSQAINENYYSTGLQFSQLIGYSSVEDFEKISKFFGTYTFTEEYNDEKTVIKANKKGVKKVVITSDDADSKSKITYKFKYKNKTIKEPKADKYTAA